MNKINKNYELYSFDIFDTLLTRKVAKPTGIFVLMQHIMNTDEFLANVPLDIKTNFYQYRTDAEYYLRRINNQWYDGLDITFDEIYAYIQKTYNLSQELINKIKDLEIKLEIESVVPIKENIEYVKDLLKNNKRVILISDMYLPAEVIKQMLFNADSILVGLKLYLSSELKYMKKDTKLFQYVKEQENIEYKDWIHTGDNIHADIRCANKLGIKTNHFGYVDFEYYEKKLLKNEFFDPMVQLTLGCTKNLRLNKFAKSDKANLGASLAGAILCPYIFWLLAQSQKYSINRLYFIARDGYILKEMADVLINYNKLDIKTFYTYGSRKVWRLAGLDVNNEKLYKQFVDMLQYESRKIHFALNIDKNKLIEMLPKNLNKYYKLRNRKKMLDYFANSKAIIIESIKNNEQQKSNTLCYLKNNIDYSDSNFAFVDLDGSCLTQNCLASLFGNFYDKPIKSFYYAVTQLCYEPINLEKYCFVAFKKPMLGHLIEVLTRAPHGQTLGYDDNGNPILEQIDTQALQDWEFDKYKYGILEFIFCIAQYAKQYHYVSFESQKIMNFYLEYLFETPDKKTADLLGELVHTTYGTEINRFAPTINIFGMLKYLFINRCKTQNMKFSLARSNKWIRKIIEYKQNLRKRVKMFLINRIINGRISNFRLVIIIINFIRKYR